METLFSINRKNLFELWPKLQFLQGVTGESNQNSQAGGVDELRVRLLSVWPDQRPQVPHGLLQEGICLEHRWELADPLPCHEAGKKICLPPTNRAG